MTDHDRIELLAGYLEARIANLGHPVGMGIAPARETLERIAADCLKIATYEDTQ